MFAFVVVLRLACRATEWLSSDGKLDAPFYSQTTQLLFSSPFVYFFGVKTRQASIILLGSHSAFELKFQYIQSNFTCFLPDLTCGIRRVVGTR